MDVQDGRRVDGVNYEAEMSVLGAVLLSDAALPAVIVGERLQAGDFHRETHRRIYEAMLELHAVGEPVDALTLVGRLEQRGELESVGGRVAIELLAGAVPAISNVRQYASIVRYNSRLRQSAQASVAMTPRVRSPRRDSRRAACGRPAGRRVVRAARGPDSDDGPEPPGPRRGSR